jgi:hypothetical protein
MALSAPAQQRSVDPYSNRRFSSVFNRITRVASAGSDIILFPNQSFRLSRLNWKEVKVESGVCVKDDVLIHVTEDFYIDFSDNDYYVDDTGAMTSAAYYYVVLQYLYARSLPAPKAWIKVIRDITSLYTGHEHQYIYLGSVLTIWNGSESRYEVSTVYHNTPIERPIATGNWMLLDGGELS